MDTNKPGKRKRGDYVAHRVTYRNSDTAGIFHGLMEIQPISGIPNFHKFLQKQLPRNNRLVRKILEFDRAQEIIQQGLFKFTEEDLS